MSQASRVGRRDGQGQRQGLTKKGKGLDVKTELVGRDIIFLRRDANITGKSF